MALTQTQVSQLYVSLFGRASEGEGNTFWQAQSDMTTAANNMLATTAATTYFGGTLTNQAFVEYIYLNTLGKTYAQDTAGVNFWVAALATNSRGAVVSELIKSAVAIQAAAPTDASNQFTNRVAVSDYTATTLATAPADYATSTAFNSANKPTGALTVTHVASTVDTAKAAIVTLVPHTFTLTTGTDAGTAFTGGAGADTFNAAVLTANDNDILAGGAGADVLNLETASSITENFKTSGIETVNLNALGAVTVDAKNLSGMTTLNSNDAAGAVTVNNLAATAIVGVKGSATNNVDLNYTTGALNGTADKLTVNLNGSSATTVTADAGFESVEVNTTAASTLTTLTASGATALTLSGSATLETAAASIDSFTDYTVTNTAKVTYNDIATVKTFSASTNTGGIVGKDLTSSAELVNGTSADVLTMSSNGSLIQTGSGADNINVNTAALLSTNSGIIKLGAGNDILALTAGTSGEYVYAEAGDDTIYLATATTSADLIDGGEGTDTLNFLGNDLTYAMIAKGIENVNVGVAGKDTTVNFVTIDSAVAITDKTDDAVTFTNLLNGTTYTSNVAKDEALSLGFKSAQAATLNVNLTKGSTGAVTLTNVADATLTYGATSVMAGAITTDAANTKLTIAATGALTGGQAIAASGTEKLETVTVTGNNTVTLGAITNDAKLTSVTASSTGGAVTLGTVGAAGNTTADVTVTKISATSTAGKAVIGDIDFSGVATTVTGNIAEITATGAAGTAAATTIGAIAADKLGTVTSTSSNHNATIGNIVAGDDTAITAGIDGTITALKASGYLVATIGTVKADSVGSIIVESTDTATGGAASVGAITDGSNTAAGTSIAEIGTIDITSRKSSAATGAIDAAKLGNVTLNGATTATTGAITIANAAANATMGNLSVTAGTGAATLGAISAQVADTVTVKSTSAGVVHAAMAFSDTTAVTVSITAGTTVEANAADDKISNAKGDLNVTVIAAGAFGATNEAEVEAGSATVTDIDIVVDASAVAGAVGAAGAGNMLVVNNLAEDTASSTIVKGGIAANFITIDGHAGTVGTGGTITYYGQTAVDTITLSSGYITSTVYAEAGDDVIVTGSGVDTIYAGAGIDAITAGAGLDIIYLVESAASVDTITTGAAASTNSDTITSFTLGNGGDKLAFTNTDTTGTGASAAANVFTLSTTGVAAANEIIVLAGATYATAALAETALDTYAGATITATDDVIMIYSNGTNAYVYKDANAGTDTAAGADLTLIATLVGITSVDTMTVQNLAAFI